MPRINDKYEHIRGSRIVSLHESQAVSAIEVQEMIVHYQQQRQHMTNIVGFPLTWYEETRKRKGGKALTQKEIKYLRQEYQNWLEKQ